MAEDGIVRALTVPLEILRDNGGDGHEHPNETVMVDADPVDVEPGQTALRGAPRTPFTAAALPKPIQGPDPGLDGLHEAEVLFLFVEVGGDVVAEEGEERGYGEGLVAVAHDLEVDGMPVIAQREE